MSRVQPQGGGCRVTPAAPSSCLVKRAAAPSPAPSHRGLGVPLGAAGGHPAMGWGDSLLMAVSSGGPVALERGPGGHVLRGSPEEGTRGSRGLGGVEGRAGVLWRGGPSTRLPVRWPVPAHGTPGPGLGGSSRLDPAPLVFRHSWLGTWLPLDGASAAPRGDRAGTSRGGHHRWCWHRLG